MNTHKRSQEYDRNESISYDSMYSSLSSYVSSYQSRPLTLENVARIQNADASGTPLARYCQYDERRYRKRKMTRQSRDSVLESPRILPFPYHNDSFFLPTAEHDYPGRGVVDTNSIVSYESHNRPHKRSKPHVTPPRIPDRAVSQKKHFLSQFHTFLFSKDVHEKKRSWFDKLRNLFRKEKKSTSTSGPVWYKTCNPSPRILS